MISSIARNPGKVADRGFAYEDLLKLVAHSLRVSHVQRHLPSAPPTQARR